MAAESLASHLSFSLDENLIAAMERDTDVDTARRIAAKIADEIHLRGARVGIALANLELGGIWREAHTLKSLAATFGIENLRCLALSVEIAGRQGDADLGARAAVLPTATAVASAAIRTRFGLPLSES